MMKTGSQSPFRDSIQRLLKRKVVKLSLCWLFLMILVAVMAPFLANDKPLFFSYQGNIFFPAFSGASEANIRHEPTGERTTIDFKNPGADIEKNATIISAPVRYAPYQSDMNNTDYVGPSDEQFGDSGKLLTGNERHLLGTGRRGDDTLSGLIHGARISMTVGVLSMTLAGFIGLIIGSMAGFFGDRQLKLSRGRIMMSLLSVFPAWFYGFQLRTFQIESALKSNAFSFAIELLISTVIFFLIILIFNQAGRLLHANKWFRKESYLMIDTFFSRLIEVLISLPRLILIISIAAISKPSLFNLVLIIGLTSWTEIARFTRAEMLRVRSLDYIQSARSLGFSEKRILFLHALPNSIAPALITISFGIAGAILIESGLSFLGIGVPPETVTWGSLLAAGKENFSAWWLVVFPGVAIFLTVTAFNLLGEGLRDAFDPRLKS